MNRDDFIRLVGPRVFHVTLKSNLAGIAGRGLLRPAEAARQAGFAPEDVALRKDTETIVARAGPMTLNHQRPLLAGKAQAAAFLSSGSLKAWAMQLDERVFFWPRRMRQSYIDSFGADADLAVLEIDAGGLFDDYADHLDLAPINSGAATRRAATRGPWIYVPATATVAAFRSNRVKRGLVKGPDTVVEVSLRCDIPGPKLSALRVAREA